MITIFTPTYNRAYILPVLYESLKKQTCKNFEWLVIDDGSKDNTKELVNRWIETEENFNIRYYEQPNGGKHRAINYAVNLAYYDWFFIVDSDDYLKDNAIELVESWTTTINGKDDFAGVAGLKCYKNGELIGQTPKLSTDGYIDATNLERARFYLNGDKSEVYKTKILKKYPFPEFNDEKFIEEASVWIAIAADGYKIRWFNVPTIVCEYLEDGLTSASRFNTQALDNFNGYQYVAKLYIKYFSGLKRITAIFRYIRIARQKNISLYDMSKNVDTKFISVFLLSIIANDVLYIPLKKLKHMFKRIIKKI